MQSHSIVFVMLDCENQRQNLQAHTRYSLATVFTQSCEFQRLVRMSLQWKNFNEDIPFVQCNLNIATGLRKLDKIHPRTVLFLLWYSHKLRLISSTFDIAMLWLWFSSVQLCYVMVMVQFSSAKMPHTRTVFARVDWTIT